MTPTLSKGQKYIAVITDATKRVTTEGAKEDGYYYATKILGVVKEFGELRPPSEVLPCCPSRHSGVFSASSRAAPAATYSIPSN